MILRCMRALYFLRLYLFKKNDLKYFHKLSNSSWYFPFHQSNINKLSIPSFSSSILGHSLRDDFQKYEFSSWWTISFNLPSLNRPTSILIGHRNSMLYVEFLYSFWCMHGAYMVHTCCINTNSPSLDEHIQRNLELQERRFSLLLCRSFHCPSFNARAMKNLPVNYHHLEEIHACMQHARAESHFPFLSSFWSNLVSTVKKYWRCFR